ncbi:MAG: pyridoxal phosphate-dependent decarboxylase family protein [Longimicrobiales bacterium]
MRDVRLDDRATPLDLTPEEFAEIGHRLVDDLAALLGSLRDRPLGPDVTPDEVRAALDASAPIPEEGMDAATLMRDSTRMLIEHSLYNAHPRFFGYVTAGAAPIGVLADLLASGINPNVGGWALSPMASEIEDQTIRWISELVGFPVEGDGVLTSGGNLANMLGFYAARAARAGWDVRMHGLRSEDAAALRVYASTATHTWIQKAADLSGLGCASIRWIETDVVERMNVAALRAAIDEDLEAGHHPFMVVATGGSVSTGAVDDLPAIRELCDAYDVWMHVDGAYGAFAARAPNVPEELRAISAADSVALDPHKWLYAPLEAGCVLVRDPSALLAAFSYRPEYYSFQQDAKNYFERGIQNSRGFRALKVWMQLKQAGRSGYVRMISEDIELARRFFEIADAHPELETFVHALSITTYRYVPDDLRARTAEPGVATYLNELNEQIQARMEKGGDAFVSNAVLGEIYALRMCVVNFRTRLEDVEALVEISAELGRAADATLRPDALRAPAVEDEAYE